MDYVDFDIDSLDELSTHRAGLIARHCVAREEDPDVADMLHDLLGLADPSNHVVYLSAVPEPKSNTRHCFTARRWRALE